MAGRRKVSISMDRNDSKNRNKCLLLSPVTDSAIVSEIISRLEVKYSQLTIKHELLCAKYEKSQAFAHEAVWEYSVATSKDFNFIPALKFDSRESENAIGQYTIDHCLRKGKYSTVSCCIRNGTEDKYVLKSIDKGTISCIENAVMVNSELKALMLLSGHMNVVGFEEVYHTPDKVHIITEWFPCDLFEFLVQHHNKMNEKIVSIITRKLLLGVEHMHAHHIVHRDLKPENILIAFNERKELFVKICDFGLARELPPVLSNGCIVAPKVVNSAMTGICGSAGFFAPECVLSTTEYCGIKADLFSIGCICLEMLSSSTFFQEEWMRAYEPALLASTPDCFLFEKAIQRVILKAHTEINHKHPLSVAEFIAGSLNLHPQSRFNLQDMLYCRWLCVAERLEKPSNIGAFFAFTDKESVGYVPKTYTPTQHRVLNKRSAHQQALSGNALRNATDEELHARMEANMKVFEAITANTTTNTVCAAPVSVHSALMNTHMQTSFMKRLHPTGGSSGHASSETKCGLDLCHVPSPSVIPAKPVEVEDSSLISMSMKRVALPGTHITLSPIAVSNVNLNIGVTASTKALQEGSSFSAPVSNDGHVTSTTFASAGHGHLSRKIGAIHSVADANSDKNVLCDGGAGKVQGVKSSLKHQTTIPNLEAVHSYSDHYANASSCEYVTDLQLKANRAELASTQAFERIQARMMSNDYSIMEDTTVVPSNTPRLSPRGDTKEASVGSSVTSTAAGTHKHGVVHHHGTASRGGSHAHSSTNNKSSGISGVRCHAASS